MSVPRHLIAVDWDGTCVYPHWEGAASTWIPGAEAALHVILGEGYEICIYTERTDTAQVRRMLDEAELEAVSIWKAPGKPPAFRFIDNRAIRFRGDWSEILPLIGIHE